MVVFGFYTGFLSSHAYFIVVNILKKDETAMDMKPDSQYPP